METGYGKPSDYGNSEQAGYNTGIPSCEGKERTVRFMQELYEPGQQVCFHKDETVMHGKIFLLHKDARNEAAYDLFVRSDPEFPDGVIYKKVPQSRIIGVDR